MEPTLEFTYESLFLKGLAQTLAMEATVVWLLVRWFPSCESPAQPGWPRVLAASTLPSLLTLPYLWFLGPWLVPDRFWRAAIGEPIIALVEALMIGLLLQCSARRAAFLSLIANVVSWQVGEHFQLF